MKKEDKKLKEYYSIAEVAEILDVSYRSIFNGIKNGRIQAFRATGGVKGHWRIHFSEMGRLSVVDYGKTIKQLKELENVE